MNMQLSWDEYFMGIADEVSKKSKESSTKVGCVIADPKHRPVSFGYNGMIQGADESKMTLTERPMKYYFVVHAEMNALIFSGKNLEGCSLYCPFATCENCLKHCLQAGIKKFVYRQLRVNSFGKTKKSMTNVDTDEAIVRMLVACPDVETLNLTNGKSYIEDILDQYEDGTEEKERLLKWL